MLKQQVFTCSHRQINKREVQALFRYQESGGKEKIRKENLGTYNLRRPVVSYDKADDITLYPQPCKNSDI